MLQERVWNQTEHQRYYETTLYAMYVCLLDNAGVYLEHEAIVGSSCFNVYSFIAVQHGHKYIDRDQRIVIPRRSVDLAKVPTYLILYTAY